MPNAAKESAVAEIVDSFRSCAAAVLTEYRGLTTADLTELRSALGADTSYDVVKNTLTRIAADQAGVSGLEGLLTGPTAVAFVRGDPVEAAKGLRDFARTHPLLVIKGGVVEGRPVSADEMRRIADLESREVLLARVAGALSASLSQAVGLFAAPLSQMARLAAALRDTLPAEPAGADAEPTDTLPAEPAGVDAEPTDTTEASASDEAPSAAADTPTE